MANNLKISNLLKTWVFMQLGPYFSQYSFDGKDIKSKKYSIEGIFVKNWNMLCSKSRCNLIAIKQSTHQVYLAPNVRQRPLEKILMTKHILNQVKCVFSETILEIIFKKFLQHFPLLPWICSGVEKIIHVVCLTHCA